MLGEMHAVEFGMMTSRATTTIGRDSDRLAAELL